jgi:hypothetical protein
MGYLFLAYLFLLLGLAQPALQCLALVTLTFLVECVRARGERT